jgi:4-hydroxy-tetrahydrodipicolinate reductase
MTDDILDIAVTGAAGRMGRMLVKAVTQSKAARLCGATGKPGGAEIGSDAGLLAGVHDLGIAIADDPAPVIARSQAVVDFTTPAATVEHARLCAQANAALIVGTTGLSADDENALEMAARHCQVVYAPNMSVGVTLAMALTEKVASVLGEDYDIEILEMHHRHKVDAPSGTALGLGKAAARGRGVDHDAAAVTAREGHTGARPAGRIGYATLRGGDVVGEHSVIFAGAGERFEIGHKASDRGIFAAGALRAAHWARQQPYGLYSMRDVLGLD